MKKSEINFTVELDDNRVPSKIFWDATENPNEGINETKAITIGVWDQYHKGLLGINLWTNDMPVDEMKHFAIDVIGNVAQMLMDATQDQKLVALLEKTCQEMTKIVEEEEKKEK